MTCIDCDGDGYYVPRALANGGGTRVNCPTCNPDCKPPRRSHGGYREGSGRKPILDGGIKRTFVLTPAHLAMIDGYGRAHNIDNRSAALRHLIEQSKD